MSVKSVNRSVRSSGHRAASSRWLGWLARAGFAARGVTYVLIGVLAVQIGLGSGGKEADRSGALHAIAVQPGGIGRVALWAYLLIAFVVLPVFVPLAVIAAGPGRRRKLMMVPFALTGTVIAVVLFAAMVRGPVGVKLDPYHLSYGIRVPDGFLIVALYVAAVCGPLLTSGYRNVVVFGAVDLVAVIVIARLTISGFASVWCGWAAISSAAITLHCRFAGPGPHRAGAGLAA